MRYKKAVDVEMIHQGSRRFLSTLQGGRVCIDSLTAKIWDFAPGHSLDEILAHFENKKTSLKEILAVLICLVEGGFLQRDGAEEAGPVPASAGGSGQPDLISAVIVVYNGRTWLESLIPDLLDQTYSSLEILVVDNSRDPNLEQWLAETYPTVRYISPEGRTTFAAGVNLGVRHARGAYTLVLNQDLRLDDRLVETLHQYALSYDQAGAIAPKIKFLWAPSFLNAIGNRVDSQSWGTDNCYGHLDLGQFDHWRELPSACFACVLVPTPRWEEVGPVDEGYEMYYEDTDWCYRARLMGFPIIFAPEAEVFHAFGGKSPDSLEEQLSPEKLRKVVYSRYRFAYKIVGDRLERFVSQYRAEDEANLANEQRLGRGDKVSAYQSAHEKFDAEKSDILALRDAIQSQRKLDDQELFAVQKGMPENLSCDGLPSLRAESDIEHYLQHLTHKRTRHFPEYDLFDMRPRLLIVSHDIVDFNMAGPGLRYLEMAKALSQFLPVSLAIPNRTEMDVPEIDLLRYSEDRPESLEVLVRNADVVLISGYMGEKFPFLLEKKTRTVVDLYDPLPLENLHYYFHEPMTVQNQQNQAAVDALTKLLNIGDFFICGNERQRDLWIGSLMNLGRINPQNYEQDPSFRRLIDVVGTGFPDEFPPTRPYLRGVHEAVPEDAKMVLWGGGIWNWLDPISLIQAWPAVVAAEKSARLVFLGTKHPNPAVPAHEMAVKTMRLAEQLGEKDRSIIFIEWVPFNDRVNLLAEADIGVTMHPVHIETRYSIRTRVLDYFWARLPVVITEGDITSEWIRRYNLGRVVPERDPDAISGGLIELLQSRESFWEAGYDRIYADYKWSQQIRPLVNYCLEGDFAPDRPTHAPDLIRDPRYVVRAKQMLKEQGLFHLILRAGKHLLWRLSGSRNK